MVLNYQPCEQLRIIPQSKINLLKDSVIFDCKLCSKEEFVNCNKCDIKVRLIDRYRDANIPLEFYSKTINDFKGDNRLYNLYDFITKDLKSIFVKGDSYCLRGQHGVGKTMFSSLLLKKISEKGMSCLYTTLSDIVSILVYGDRKIKFEANRELRMVDWLTIDEFDSRFMGSDVSAELFGRVLESIIRIRFQNLLPTILITNNPDPTKALGEQLGPSILSLISGHCIDVPVIGKDFRRGL